MATEDRLPTETLIADLRTMADAMEQQIERVHHVCYRHAMQEEVEVLRQAADLLAERDELLKVCKDAHTELDSAIWDGNTVDWMGRVVSRLESAIRAATTNPDRTEGG